MPLFAILTFLVAFSIEGLGTLVSVIGLSALFGANPIIIAFAIALDAGKLVVVSLLYKYWKKLNALMRSYALIAAMITMIITSAGAAGYLSGEFQKAMTGSAEGGVKVAALQKEQAKLEDRKKQIDRQIENIPEKYTARQRTTAIAQFKEEQQQVTKRLTEIDKELPELQTKQISVEAKAGPILAIAKSFNITPEEAVKWVILVIILVFDPLAVFLIVAGNFLYEKHREEKEEQKVDTRDHKAIDDYLIKTFSENVDPDDLDRDAQAVVDTLEDEMQIPPPKAAAPVDLKLREIEPVQDLIDVPALTSQMPALTDAVVSIPSETQDFEESKFGELPMLDLPPIDMHVEPTREVIKMKDLKTHAGTARSSLENVADAPRSSLEDVDVHGDIIDGTRQLSRDVRRLYESPTLVEANTGH